MQHPTTFTVGLKKDPDSGWFAIRCVELPEAISKGKTEEEALRNIKEAIELVLDEHNKEAKKEGGWLTEITILKTACDLWEPSTLHWLLEQDQPSIRYLTLTQILGRKENDLDVRTAK